MKKWDRLVNYPFNYRSSWRKFEDTNEERDFDKHPPSDIDITFIKRNRWWGLKPDQTRVGNMKKPHESVCFVSTESPFICENYEECIKEVQETQKRNMKHNNWPDIPFNFLIGGDGIVYEGRGWWKKYVNFGNSAMHETLHIGYIGPFKDQEPPEHMTDLGSKLIEYGIERKLISEDYKYIACPASDYYTPWPSLEWFWNSPRFAEIVRGCPPQRVFNQAKGSY